MRTRMVIHAYAAVFNGNHSAGLIDDAISDVKNHAFEENGTKFFSWEQQVVTIVS
jgi:hypothetical protein